MSDLENTDAHYEQAVGMLVLSKRASTSFLQRRLGIGYNAACRLMERAEDEGIVSRPNYVGKRDVLVGFPASEAARIRELETEVAALREARRVRPQFPILGANGAKVDLQLVVDHGKQAEANHGQSVTRLMERGGLDWTELYAVLHNRRWQAIDGTEAMIACRSLESRYLAALEPDPVTVGEIDILRMIIAKLEQCESDVAPWALKWCDKLASALLEGATLEIVIEDLRALADAGEAG